MTKTSLAGYASPQHTPKQPLGNRFLGSEPCRKQGRPSVILNEPCQRQGDVKDPVALEAVSPRPATSRERLWAPRSTRPVLPRQDGAKDDAGVEGGGREAT